MWSEHTDYAGFVNQQQIVLKNQQTLERVAAARREETPVPRVDPKEVTRPET